MSDPLRKVLHQLARPIERRAARVYQAGPRLADAMAVCQRLKDTGKASILGFQNKATEDSRVVADAYLEAIDALAGTGLDCYLSVKAPPLQFSHELFGAVLARSREARVRLHLDSHALDTAGPTFALLDRAGPAPLRDIGVTLPGRWKRSLADADWAVERGVSVRVVKGQWEDPADPGRDPGQGFLQVIDRLAGRAAHVGIASHNAPLVRESARRLREKGTSCELELLYGLPARGALSVAGEFSMSSRMYVPYGCPSLPYSAGDVLRNLISAWWLLRDVLRHAELTNVY